MLYLIDTKAQAFAVYRVEPTGPKGSGTVKLEAARQYRYDLKLSEYNNQPPEVSAVEAMVRVDGQVRAGRRRARRGGPALPTPPRIQSYRTERPADRPDSIARSTSMAQFYTLEEAARVLGMGPEDLKPKAQHREVRAFMDGGSWQFRVADIDELARRRGLGSDPELSLSDLDLDVPDGSGSDEIDLSEFQLGAARPDLGQPTTDLAARRAPTTTRTSSSTTSRCRPARSPTPARRSSA